MQLLWKIRRKIVAQLESAPCSEHTLDRQAGLRAGLRGIDLFCERTLTSGGAGGGMFGGTEQSPHLREAGGPAGIDLLLRQ